MKTNILQSTIFLIAALSAGAQTPLAQDAYVITGNAGNFGSATTLTVAAGSQALAQFDLSMLPAGLASASSTLLPRTRSLRLGLTVTKTAKLPAMCLLP